MPLSFWIVHLARLRQRLDVLEQTLQRRRLRREREERLYDLWRVVTATSPYV